MKSLLIFIAFLALGAFAAHEYWTVESLNEKVSLLTMQLNAPQPPPPLPTAVPTVSNKRQIVCPVCRGQKVVVYDPTGGDDPLNKKRRECPVCLGAGSRIVTIPADQALCPDCKGMGIMYHDSQAGEPPRFGNCVRCGATGLVGAGK
jgi:DnaJ-class molecular chaperone